MNEPIITSFSKEEIVTYKEESGIIYGYLNQKALDYCIYNRAKELTHGFTDKNQFGFEWGKRPIWLSDIETQKHSILIRHVNDGDYVSKGNILLEIGIVDICLSNNIFTLGTDINRGFRVYAPYNGFVTNIIKGEVICDSASKTTKNAINDGDLLFTIKLTENMEEDNSIIKELRFDYSLFPSSFLDEIRDLSKITIYKSTTNYSYVNKGDVIFVFADDSYDSHYVGNIWVRPPTTTFNLKSPYSGLFVWDEYCHKHKGDSICKFYPDETYLIERYKYSFKVTKDDFTKTTIVNCLMINDSRMNKNGFYLRNSIWINFEYVGGNYYMLVKYNKKDLKLTKQCSFHFLLDNDNVVTLTPIAKPINEICRFQMSFADLDNLESAQFIKWKITNEEGIMLLSGINCCCVDYRDPTDITQKISHKVFNNFIRDFKKTVKESTLEEVVLRPDSPKTEANASCYVYLMIDTTNNLHKIGISNKPKYREHTLQSDKPTIELICAKEYPTRATAEAIEAALHRVYANKRIRGEWFNLNPSDIETIKQTLK